MFPAFAHFRRTTTRDTELNGQPIRQGEKVVMWYVSSNRNESATRTPTASTSPATPSTRPSAPAAGTSAWAPLWRGSNCGSCSRRRWRAFPRWSSWAARFAESPFINQLKTLPVRLRP